MKRIYFTLLLLLFPAVSFSQDFVVAGAVAGSTIAEKNALDGISREQGKISKIQATVTANLVKMNAFQDKIYKVLSTVSANVTTANELVTASDLSKDIHNLIRHLLIEIGRHPEGFATTVVGTKSINKLKIEMASSYALIASVVTNKKILLNTYERLRIAQEIVERLERIKFDLQVIIYSTKVYTFRDIPRLLTPDLYYKLQNNRDIAERIIKSWK